MIKDYVSMSARNVRKRGIRSWLTMIGIFIGIAAVVSLISLGDGLQNAITGQFDTLDPNKLTVTNVETGFGPPGSTAVQKLTKHDLELIEDIGGVRLAVARLIRVVEVEYNDVSRFRYVTNIPEEQEDIDLVYDSLNVKPAQGSLLDRRDKGQIVLGNSFIEEDSFGREIRVGKRINVGGESFQVKGILEKAGSFQINSVIFMQEEDLKRVLDIDDEIDLIVVEVEDQNELDAVAERIREKIRDDRNLDVGEDDFSVQTPQQTLETINIILDTINIVVGAIAGISLLVGGIGIANTMYTSVLERTKEIGVMKAVGAKDEDILILFLIESAALGFVGGVVGAIIGLGLAFVAALGVNFIFPALNFGVSFSFPLVAAAIIFSLVIGGLSGIVPAYRASKLKPVEALRA